MKLILFLLPLIVIAQVPDGSHPRIHSSADLARLVDHYSDNDLYWTSLTSMAGYDDRLGMYAKALKWKADGTQSDLDDAIDYLNNLTAPDDASPTFTGGNDYRRYANLYPLTYDIVYDSLTAQERIEIGDLLNEWVEYTDFIYTNPQYLFDTYHLDTDGYYSTARTYVMVGIVTYNNGSTNYDTTNCRLKANYLRLDTDFDYYMKLGLTTGYNWEGDAYNSHTKRYIMELLWAMNNGIGYDYTQKYSGYNNFYDNWVEWYNYMVPPDFNLNQALTYCDADGHRKDISSEHCYVAAYLSLKSANHAGWARWWADYFWDATGTERRDYSPWMCLWFDDDLSTTSPIGSKPDIWFTENTMDSTSKEGAVKMYYEKKIGTDTTMFSITCPVYNVDHQHNDTGNFFYWRNGEKLIWEYRTYEAGVGEAGAYTHNTFQVYNESLRENKYYPMSYRTRNDGNGYPSADVGMTKYRTDTSQYVYTRLDMYGDYRPRWNIYDGTETTAFVDVAWRSVVIIDDIIFMQDKNFWNGSQDGEEYRRHHTIWWTASEPAKNGTTVTGVTSGGQYMFGHYLMPHDIIVDVVDDSIDNVASCDNYEYPACDDLHYSIDATEEDSTREDSNFLTVFYTNDSGDSLDVDTISVSGNIGAYVTGDTNYVAIFANDTTLQTSVEFSFFAGTSKTKCVICDLAENTTFSIIASGTTTKTITISSTGSTYETDENGVLAFDISGDNTITAMGLGEAGEVIPFTKVQTILGIE